MNEELSVLRDVTERLTRSGIACMLTGSMALNLYAEPRMTRDMDIVLDINAETVQRLSAVFEPDYYISHEELDFAPRTNGMFNLIHQKHVVKIDCIVKKPDTYSLAAFARRKKMTIDGFELDMLSKEDLIIAKLFWLKETDSAQQKRDIQNLLQSGYDERLLHTLTDLLGLTNLLRSVK